MQVNALRRRTNNNKDDNNNNNNNNNNAWLVPGDSASEMTGIVSSGALNSTH